MVAMLQQLGELRVKGLLTKQEFKLAKAEVIAELSSHKKTETRTETRTPTQRKNNWSEHHGEDASASAETIGRNNTAKTRPITSTKPKTARARRVRDEARCAQVTGQMMASGSPSADVFLKATLNSRIAKTLFLKTSATIEPESHLMQLATNVK
jgi:hypothetical protein